MRRPCFFKLINSFNMPIQDQEKRRNYDAELEERKRKERERCQQADYFHWSGKCVITGFNIHEHQMHAVRVGKTYKVAKMLAILLLPIMSMAQPFAEVGAGLSSRLMPSVKVDAGYISANRNYAGPMLAATTVVEPGMAASAGGYAGWQTYGLAVYAGAGYMVAKNSKLQEAKQVHPIAGISYRWPENRTVADLRYQHNSIHLILAVRLGKNHNQ